MQRPECGERNAFNAWAFPQLARDAAEKIKHTVGRNHAVLTRPQ